MKQIITHNDLDGIASAALLIKATGIKKVIFSNEVEYKKLKINKNTIIADLNLDPRCGLWFDHHISHKTNKKFKGSFTLKKSCARVIFNYFNKKFSPYYKNLVQQLDKADSGNFSLQDIKKETPLFQLNSFLFLYPFKNKKEESFILSIVLYYLLLEIPIQDIIKNKIISKFLKKFKDLNKKSLSFIKKKSITKNKTIIIDSSDKTRAFNPFLIFLNYPKIKYLLIIDKSEEKNKLAGLIVRNKFNKFSQKSNIGLLCKKYNGGGHKEIGGFRLSKQNKEKIIMDIVEQLK